MDYKFIPISETVSVPVSVSLTPEQENEYIALIKACNNPAQLEAECQELEELLNQPDQWLAMDEFLGILID